jgi:hypothetical protein
MKKIFTLSIVLLSALFSFADYAPSRLSVTTVGNANVRITVDENRYGQQVAMGSTTFEGLTPGYHTVRVYEMDQRRGFFGRKQTMRLLYTATVNIKPMFQLNIVVNKNGRAMIDEQPIRRGYDKGWNDADHRNDKGNGRYDNDKRYDDHGKGGFPRNK